MSDELEDEFAFVEPEPLKPAEQMFARYQGLCVGCVCAYMPNEIIVRFSDDENYHLDCAPSNGTQVANFEIGTEPERDEEVELDEYEADEFDDIENI